MADVRQRIGTRNKMKKVLIGIIMMMAIAFVLGISWGKLFKRGYTRDEYGVELAKRDSRRIAHFAG